MPKRGFILIAIRTTIANIRTPRARFALYNSLAWLMWRDGYAQKRHQKVFNMGLQVCAGAFTLQIFQKLQLFLVFHPSIWGSLELYLRG